MGEAVPRLPPSVAPLRISLEANCGNTSVQQRHPAGQPGLDLRQAQRGAEVDVVRADGELAQLGEPFDADGQLGPGVPDVQLDAPVGGPGHQPRVRVGGQQVQGLGQVAGRT